ncbi:MAG: hypothetical protein U0995_00175 [Erythrobacter sp.]|nr:hypothetical protein [Erythrobacter sp.]
MKSFIKATGITLALIVGAVPAHADTYTLSVGPTGAQSVRYDRGIASVDSVQEQSIVRIVNVPGNDKKTVAFVIGIVNASGEPLNFGPENVSVRPTGMPPIALTTFEQAMEAERKKQAKEKFWAGVAAFGRGLSAADAGNTYTSGVYSGTASGWVGNSLVTAHGSGIYSGTEYNSGAALAAQRDAREMNAQDRANLEQRWAARSSDNENLLRTTTVDAGMMYGGIATFSISKEVKKTRGPVQVMIEVDVGGERHTFFATLSDSPAGSSMAITPPQQSLAGRPVSAPTAKPTLDRQIQVAASEMFSQLPLAVGGNGVLIDVQAQRSHLVFVVKFSGTSVPEDGKFKLETVCSNGSLAPLLKEGATLQAAYLDYSGVRIGTENVEPSDCGFK